MPSPRVKFEIKSNAVAALVEQIRAIDRKVARKGLRDGINDATKAVMWDVKAMVPRRSGQLRKAIGRKVYVKKGGAVIYGIVGPRKGFRVQYQGKWIDPVKYAHLVEYGRREVVAGVSKGKPTGKKVLSTGKGGTVFGKKVRSVAPRPFLRPAWEQNEGRVVGLITAALNRALSAYFARARSKKAG